MNRYNFKNEMREPLKLNNHPVNQHAKFLLTQIDPKDDPEEMYRLPNLNYVPVWAAPDPRWQPYPKHVPRNRHPTMYFLRLMEWVLEEQRLKGIYLGNQQMLLGQVWELKEIRPLQAWKWLNLGREHEAFQMTKDPIQGAEVAVKILLKQLVKEQQKIHGPNWEIGRRRMTDDDLIDWINEES